MALPEIVLVIAVLLAVISFAEPLAQRLRLPASVMLAIIGIAIGAAAALLAGQSGSAIGSMAQDFAELPISSAVFLFIFLPALLFQAALTIEVRDLAEDAVPILTMAVVAVLATTLAVGFALWPVSGQPLIVCLLIAAIVATTDPSAVVAIFRDLGAPQRLNRLVEGESLLNDAVAITLFVVFLDVIATAHSFDLGGAGLRLVLAPLGGMVLGLAGGRLVTWLFALGADNRLVQVSLSVPLPYIVFVAAEHLHLSGPIAVVAAGLMVAGGGPARVSPSAWRYLQEVWEQLIFWASSLVFILAAILVPKLLGSFGRDELVLLAILVAAAFAARAAVLYGVLPLLSRLGFSPPVSPAYRAVMLWGGLRGAATLALALAVTEHPAVPEPTQRFVAVLATAFVLFTLIVQGTTLRFVIRALKLDRLSPVDASLREQALDLARQELREAVAATAKNYALEPRLAAEVAAEFDAARSAAGAGAGGLGAEARIGIGMAALAAREQDFVLQQLEHRTMSPALVEPLRAAARRLFEAARGGGAAGYAAEASRALGFSRKLRIANALHRRFKVSGPLERQLATRFEMLIVSRILIRTLIEFAQTKLQALHGPGVGEAAAAALAARGEATARALDALRLQYPDYAEQLERRFLKMSALRREQQGYERLYEEGLIGPEVKRALIEVVVARMRAETRPRLDLRLNTATLLGAMPMFQSFGEAERAELETLMQPAFAIPGERLVTKGERGDAAFFIASGAVEVDTGGGRGRVRLGRGEVFGELALLTGEKRGADVTAIAFCELLVLTARDFHRFLEAHPGIRSAIERVAAERLSANRATDGAAPA
jgi:CPA1 family monovalent cation:H+ antiporter